MEGIEQKPLTVRIGHSPDPDDAFMWYALADDPTTTGPDGEPLRPKIETGRFRFVHVLEDIQSLNERSLRGELEITALSIAHYPYVADRYALTSCGASMGEDYGPMVIVPESSAVREVEELRGLRIAVPGEQTSAFLGLCLVMGGRDFAYEVVPFDEIIEATAAGRFDAGLIIHEGQLTYAREGMRLIADLGVWWRERTGLPLPLGGNAVRRDLVEQGGEGVLEELTDVLLRSIRYAMDHREDCLAYALGFGRGLDTETADRFVGMYVNERTLDYGDEGREAIRRFLSEGAEAGVVPPTPSLDFISPASAAS